MERVVEKQNDAQSATKKDIGNLQEHSESTYKEIDLINFKIEKQQHLILEKMYNTSNLSPI